MNLVAALAFGVLLGAGVHLMVGRDLVRLAGGTLLISNAAIFLLVSAGFGDDRAPILPVEPGQAADPLVQALALTAIVIAFGATVLLLRVAAAVEQTHGSLDLEEMVRAEESDERAEEEGGGEVAGVGAAGEDGG